MTFLDVMMEPSVSQMKSAGDAVEITCSIDIDENYPLVAVSWKHGEIAVS